MAFDQRAATKAPRRSRWNANQQQLQTLEGMFEQGNGNTPNKARIKVIALELAQYGSISETNVYNWFQNRKARAKRKLQHQVGRRRRLPRSSTDNAPNGNRKENAVKAGEDNAQVTSPRAKRSKTERDHHHHHHQQLDNVHNESLGSLAPTPPDLGGAGSSGVEEITGLEEHLRSHHVDFATLATDPQLPNVDITADILFSEHHFHEQGTVESPSGQLNEISEEVEAWDVRNSFGESSSQMVESQLPYTHNSSNNNNDDDDGALDNFSSGLAGEKLISLAGGPVPSMDESRKGVAETRGLKTHDEAIVSIQAAAAAASETCKGSTLIKKVKGEKPKLIPS